MKLRSLTVVLAGRAQLCAVQALRGRSASHAIIEVITDQIDALRDRDWERAFRHVSPAMRRAWGTADRFAQMLHDGYPMVCDPEEVQYLDLRLENGRYRQRVRLTRRANVHVVDYAMIETPTGWCVDGVAVLPLRQLGA